MAKTTSKNREALLEENTMLKDKLKELLSLAKNKEEIQGLEHTGLGLAKIDGQYKLVELKYNPITKEAQVTEVRDASRNNVDLAMAIHGAKEFLITKIVEETRKH
jgi:hypothetical protein